jgi:hypothetical protein
MEGEEGEEARPEGDEPAAAGAAAVAPVAVRVAVRVRPLSERERAMGCRECVTVQGAATTLSAEPGVKGKDDKTFVFDYSYWHDVPQGVVYRDLAKPIVEAALDGFNGVIFVRKLARQNAARAGLTLTACWCCVCLCARACRIEL